ncbi:hypothetical protein R3P38DRAFT_2968070 [Favolaschia claudopus]|uniref:Uncharacterized protein n=1 Tax=Favolaschia claudopus TaxID=2862362 RepID=A0AAW0B415_9AGAR
MVAAGPVVLKNELPPAAIRLDDCQTSASSRLKEAKPPTAINLDDSQTSLSSAPARIPSPPSTSFPPDSMPEGGISMVASRPAICENDLTPAASRPDDGQSSSSARSATVPSPPSASLPAGVESSLAVLREQERLLQMAIRQAQEASERVRQQQHGALSGVAMSCGGGQGLFEALTVDNGETRKASRFIANWATASDRLVG